MATISRILESRSAASHSPARRSSAQTALSSMFLTRSQSSSPTPVSYQKKQRPVDIDGPLLLAWRLDALASLAHDRSAQLILLHGRTAFDVELASLAVQRLHGRPRANVITSCSHAMRGLIAGLLRI